MHDAPHVDVEHPTPIIERLVLDQVEGGDARVVAQHVDPPEPIERHLRQSFDGCRIGDVDGHGERVGTVAAQTFGDRLGFATVEVGEHDRGARGRECLGERAADATGGAGHHRDPPGADHRISVQP